MATTMNEALEHYVEYTDNTGYAWRMFISGDAARIRAYAQSVAKDAGNTSVELVQERVTWRGQRGKRTREEIARFPYHA